jgi:hypothetical protein
MAVVMSKLYVALRSANVPDELAMAAAEEAAARSTSNRLSGAIGTFDASMKVLFVLVITAAVMTGITFGMWFCTGSH